jgi:secondary thiamine-phosphate synthase enzyme
LSRETSEVRQAPARVVERLLAVKTARRTELVDVTEEIARVLAGSGIVSGLCHLYVPHTTAGITVNENDDPAVPRDLEAALDRLVPPNASYRHAEGNADSHIKSTLTGVSRTIPVEQGRLALGRWQGVFFCEFDGPRERQLRVKIVADPGG